MTDSDMDDHVSIVQCAIVYLRLRRNSA